MLQTASARFRGGVRLRRRESEERYVKENVVRRPVVSLGWLMAACGACLLALGLAALVDVALPEPLTRDAPPHRFIAELAHEHLVNLTAIGPRVAGSYESDVLAAGLLVEAARAAARGAAPHVRVDVDVQRVSGAFPLTFMDGRFISFDAIGMNHVYRDVQNVVVRVRAAGAASRAPRSALLLNCHIDTVPDSPGASDDGAGCAVLLETLRALSVARSPPRHDVIFLFNGAEENVLQGSHGFITQHKWAKSVRAFINIEACGAGGREVLFQAGPREPWIVEVYAGAVPHPFASSLAQELFESGLIPADTDFRIFRDFGKLSGVDLAWSSNGYVYHTALDTAERVAPAVLQRTGDNVLALTHGLVGSERLEGEPGGGGGLPVYFDVLGLLVLSARAPVALLAAALALALPALDVHLVAKRAERELLIGYGAWWRAVGRGAACWALCGAGGAAAAAGLGGALHALRAPLAYYSRPALLAPLYALPALGAAWTVALRAWSAGARRSGLPAGGWWSARALQQGGGACCAGLLAACGALRLRSGFAPALWAALPALAGCLHSAGGGAGRGWGWLAGAALPVAQTWYLALGSLRMLVPIAGRAGPGPALLPPDVVVATLTAVLALSACCWLLPLVVASRNPRRLIWGMCAVSACAYAHVLSGAGHATYARDAPRRLMLFHVRRTVHEGARDVTEHLYWMPQLDVNTPRSLDKYAPELGRSESVRPGDAACSLWVYCGLPYYLPVLHLLPASHRAPAPDAPAVRLQHALSVARLNRTHAHLTLRAAGAAHAVVIVSPGAGARVAWSSALERPLAGRRWGGRDVYFFAIHSARAPAPDLTLLVVRERGDAEPTAGAQVSLAAHALFGAERRTAAHERLLRRMPRWVAATGWGVDLHLYRL